MVEENITETKEKLDFTVGLMKEIKEGTIRIKSIIQSSTCFHTGISYSKCYYVVVDIFHEGKWYEWGSYNIDSPKLSKGIILGTTEMMLNAINHSNGIALWEYR